MVWTLLKPEDDQVVRKDTRWDRIRKKNTTNANLSSPAVRKFIGMDFIGKNNTKILNGDVPASRQINPALEMDIRHKLFKRSTKTVLSDSEDISGRNKANIDKCIAHNQEVEEHYYAHKLNKLRDEMDRNRQKWRITPKALDEHHLKLDNSGILQSLENSTKHIEDFYQTPLDAIDCIAGLGTETSSQSKVTPGTDRYVGEDIFENTTNFLKDIIDEEFVVINGQEKFNTIDCINEVINFPSKEKSDLGGNAIPQDHGSVELGPRSSDNTIHKHNLNVAFDKVSGMIKDFEVESNQNKGYKLPLGEMDCLSAGTSLLGSLSISWERQDADSSSKELNISDEISDDFRNMRCPQVPKSVIEKFNRKRRRSLPRHRLGFVSFGEELLGSQLATCERQSSDLGSKEPITCNKTIDASQGTNDFETHCHDEELDEEPQFGLDFSRPFYTERSRKIWHQQLIISDDESETLDTPKQIEILNSPREELHSVTNSISKNSETRCVRFEDPPKVVEFSRAESISSTTSTRIESEMRCLAKEALNEVEVEDAPLNIKIEGSSLQKQPLEPLVVTRIQPVVEQLPEYTSDSISIDSSEETDEGSIPSEQNTIIKQLFQAKSHSNTTLLKTYFFKWMHYTTFQKIENQNFTSKNDRVRKINAFLDHIRREKKSNAVVPVEKQVTGSKIQMAHIAKKYQSKIKIQQDIIDLQKVKLERQERLITELKLNKLSEEVREAREDIKTELKNIIRNGDPRLRAKAKCLQITGNLRDEEDEEFARLQGKALIQPKFLANMHERAIIRSVRHEQAKQRRMQQDAEREAAKMAAEEAKRLEDEEAKRMRIELLREKRRQEKMAKVLKERERQRSIENDKKSKAFCRKYLLNRVGMNAFKKLLEIKRTNEIKSDTFKRNLIKKTAFRAWKDLYVEICERKQNMVDELHTKFLKRTMFKAWVFYLQEEKSKYLVACDWYDLKLTQVVFAQWNGHTKLQKLVENMKMKQAELHHEWHLKWKVLDRWQRLPQILKLERETDERRQRWRLKIWELLQITLQTGTLHCNVCLPKRDTYFCIRLHSKIH